MVDHIPATVQDLFQTVDVLDLLMIIPAAEEHSKLNSPQGSDLGELVGQFDG